MTMRKTFRANPPKPAAPPYRVTTSAPSTCARSPRPTAATIRVIARRSTSIRRLMIRKPTTRRKTSEADQPGCVSGFAAGWGAFA